MEKDKCIGCHLCEKHCPDTSNCIYLESNYNPKIGRRFPTKFQVNTNICCFCGICTEVCPTNALQMSKSAETALYDKEEGVIDLLKSDQEVRPEIRPKKPLYTGRLREIVGKQREMKLGTELLKKIALDFDIPQALSQKNGQADQPKDFHWIKKNIPCQVACPALTDVPGYIGAISHQDYALANKINQHYNILPGTLGRVCPKPCESACRHGYSGNGDPVSICFLKRAANDFDKVNGASAKKIFPSTGKKIAVVGSGPAGLTVANDLAILGHTVKIYEAYHKPGGMLIQGIPEFRLPRDIIESDIDRILKLNVEIQCNTYIGRDITLEKLINQYDAVIMACGTLKLTNLGIHGENLEGIKSGLKFMRDVNRHKKITTGKKVIVIGGGFTAIDCARSSYRLGGREVAIYYRRTKAETSVTKKEIHELHSEGVKFYELYSPVEFIGENGKVTGVTFIRNELGPQDESGRRSPVAIKGSEINITADTIILATGQKPVYSPMTDIYGETLLQNGWLYIDPDTHETRIQKVFATGDYISGASTVIEAVGMARKTANKVDTYLMGYQRRKTVVSIEDALKTGRTRQDDFIPRTAMPTLPIGKRKSLNAEVDLGFSKKLAVLEARRCYLCHYKYEIDMTKCVFCELCILASPKNLNCIKRVAKFEYDENGIMKKIHEAKGNDKIRSIWIDG
ncbi:FAD-dependent oxidoreductase, partial [Candidatus Peregrinibacteria bacterium]|nr:FAD-dependent oxidoreductase [Candidatus Peregrinibacteria bacterium]